MPVVLVNPMNESAAQASPPAPRLSSLRGKTVTLLDISKPGGGIFLDRLEALLKERHGVARVVRLAKPTFTKPAPGDLIQQVIDAGSHAVVEALAD